MTDDERYVLNCPHCGQVEGYVPDAFDVDGPGAAASDDVIEEEVVATPAGPATRIRCPRCGRWLRPDRARPA